MIQGIHGLFYSNQPEELRAFIRDKLKLPFTDVHQGWLIFDFKEGDLGVHPTEDDAHSGTHDISFFTDDLEGTVVELAGRGVVFDDEISERGYGAVIHFTMPGGVRVQLYQPRYVKNRAAPPAATPPKRVAKKKASPKKRAAPKKASPKKKTAPKKASPKKKPVRRPAASARRKTPRK